MQKTRAHAPDKQTPEHFFVSYRRILFDFWDKIYTNYWSSIYSVVYRD